MGNNVCSLGQNGELTEVDMLISSIVCVIRVAFDVG